VNDHSKATAIGGFAFLVFTVGLWPTDFRALSYVTGVLGALMLLDSYYSRD
jgi:hypothetical protein